MKAWMMMTAAAASVATALAAAPAALACAFADTELHFHGDHPDSVPVAVAAAGEIAAGRLTFSAPEDRIAVVALQFAAAEHLKAMGERVVAALPADRFAAVPEFFVLMVQTRLWGRMRPEGGQFSATCDPIAPDLIHEAEEHGALLITSEPVIRALAEGRVSFAEAVERRLVILTGAAEPVERVRAALTEGLPRVTSPASSVR